MTLTARLAELARQLTIPYWQERRDGADRILLIAGARGVVKPASDALTLTLRPKAATAVQGVKRQLIAAGLLTEDRDALLLARMPDEAEAGMLRELLGLQRGWAS
jgi:hypothetical protein